MDIVKIDSEDQPNRCQAVNKMGQCSNVGIRLKNDDDGQPVYGQYCLLHGGNRAVMKECKERLQNYQLGVWQGRIEQGKASPELKTLNDEIVILRMMLEERFKLCVTNTDLLLHSSAVSDLVIKIEKLVVSCHKLEKARGQVLDKQCILNFGSTVIQIITHVLVDDPEKIDMIGDRILEEIGKIGEEG